MEIRGWIVEFTELAWLNIKNIVQTDDYLEEGDYYGCFKKGALCIDIVLRSDDKEWSLCGDAYILGEDTGYGYTRDNETPYDEADGCIFEYNIHKRYDDMVDSIIDQLGECVDKIKRWKIASERTDLVWKENV